MKKRTAPKKKVAVKKPKENKTNSLFKKVVSVTIEPNWSKIPVGTLFSAKINGKLVSRRIQKYGSRIFFCQSKVNGLSCENKLGFRYSYSVGDGSLKDLESNHTVITNLKLDPKFKRPVVLPKITIGSNTVEFKGNYIAVGCQRVSHAVLKKIYHRAITLKYKE